VVLVTGPSHLTPPAGVEVRRVETAAEMRDAVAAALPHADALVMAAAVADFRPADPAREKLKKEAGGPPDLFLERTADVLASTRDLRRADAVIVGFALETEDVVANGRRKLEAKGLDLLVVNDAREPGAGFEVATNRVTLLETDREDDALPLMSKAEVADRILDRVEALVAAKHGW
jgi:phosphopantothenoylcysteine decarboxylase/phosphopantothenate--cysteine ligase